jgi:FKBP-type peptidyl-prolyl cis-trans isomerase
LKGIEYLAVADTSNDFIAGLEMGQQILQLYKGVENQYGIPINKSIFIKHLRDRLMASMPTEDELHILQDRIVPLMDRTMETTPKAIMNKKAGEEYMANLKNDKNYTFTESGIAYKVIKEGTGDYFTEDNVVNIRYEGRRLNGEVFDGSDDEPVPFNLSAVITGFSEMVQLMKPGGKVTVVIPAEQAYGVQGQGAIEPNETLIFDIEALGIQE